MKWNHVAGSIGAITVLFLLVATLTPVLNVVSRAVTVSSDLQPSDAIVILGSGLLNDGTLNPASMGRLVFGLRLYKQGLSHILILSGQARKNTAPESTVRARIATELGIPQSAILEMSDVNTTRDEAREAAALLADRNLKQVLLVTDSLHMLRSKMVFEAAGLRVFSAPADNFPAIAVSPADRLILLRDLLIHSSGLFYYRLAGFIS